ncbi:hypothetical protein [Nonomuraea sp. NPDC049784]|uniref:hypothetical protein n=1 Tax=Nonomuraea sp. NPDC049784 TaxID=3154361 RepID=UPI003410F2DB
MTAPPVEPKKDHRAQIIVAIIGACAAIIAALIPVVLMQANKPDDKPTTSPPPATTTTAAPPHSTSSQSETAEPVGESSPDESVSVPEDYQGTWSGRIDWLVPGWGSYNTTLTITSGSLTAMVGQFNTNGGQCRGLLYLESGGGPVVLRLSTTYNVGSCSVLADVKLTLNGDDEMDYELVGAQFVNGYVNQPSPPARGVLRSE